MPHRRPTQLNPGLYVGPHRIFLTMCTLARRTSFHDADTVAAARAELLRIGRSYRVEIIAYVFMPDHFHALIEGQAADSDLLRFIKMFRQRSGRAHRVATGTRLWQEGYVDRFLRTEDATLDVVRDIAGNPIRKRLCDDLRCYPYVGSSRYSIDQLFESLA